MRVIAGEFRSRKLKSLPGMDTRPTPDRLRESLFSILQPRIEGSVFIDAYAGTGSVGIEALSRGAARVVFLERNAAAVRVIDDNLYALGIGNRGQVVRGRVSTSLRLHGAGATIVFLDPPYENEDEYTETLDWLGAHPPLLAVAQHHRNFFPREVYGALRRCRILKQGDSSLTFYAPLNHSNLTPQIGSASPDFTPESGV